MSKAEEIAAKSHVVLDKRYSLKTYAASAEKLFKQVSSNIFIRNSS
jgi:hypothetical protein